MWSWIVDNAVIWASLVGLNLFLYLSDGQNISLAGACLSCVLLGRALERWAGDGAA